MDHHHLLPRTSLRIALAFCGVVRPAGEGRGAAALVRVGPIGRLEEAGAMRRWWGVGEGVRVPGAERGSATWRGAVKGFGLSRSRCFCCSS